MSPIATVSGVTGRGARAMFAAVLDHAVDEITEVAAARPDGSR